jgi:hypothetical protein
MVMPASITYLPLARGVRVTVAFVTYLFNGQVRRVGPVELREAQSLAKEWARRVEASNVKVEEWTCTRVVDFPTTTGKA